MFYYFIQWRKYGLDQPIQELLRCQVGERAKRLKDPSLVIIDTQSLRPAPRVPKGHHGTGRGEKDPRAQARTGRGRGRDGPDHRRGCAARLGLREHRWDRASTRGGDGSAETPSSGVKRPDSARDFSGTFYFVRGTFQGFFAVQTGKAVTALKDAKLQIRVCFISTR